MKEQESLKWEQREEDQYIRLKEERAEKKKRGGVISVTAIRYVKIRT